MSSSKEIYSIPAKEYASVYLRRYCTMPGIFIAAMLAVAAIAGFDDMRWWILALMFIFIVAPMALAMTWFVVTGRDDMPLRLHPQSITEQNGNLSIEFYPYDYDAENPMSILTVSICKDLLSKADYGKRYIRVDLTADTPFDFLLIPTEAISSPQNIANE